MKFEEVVLPIIAPINQLLFKRASLVAIIGLLICMIGVFTLEVGVARTTLILIGLPMLALPFALRLFVSEHKKIGLVRFTENEILLKFESDEPVIYNVQNITNFSSNLKDYHGESRFSDIFRSSSQFTIRSGEENFASWNSNGEIIRIQFRLNTELQMKKAEYFLNRLKQSSEI